MKVQFSSAPWSEVPFTSELHEASQIFSDIVWEEASAKYRFECDTKIAAGLKPPKDVHASLNSIIDAKFKDDEREGCNGYFRKGRTWVRVTFRHKMSLGSDIYSALKVCKKEGVEVAIIIVADKDALHLISPEDANSMMSFEDLQGEVQGLTGVIDIPLLIGQLVQRA